MSARKSNVRLAGKFKVLVQQDWCVYCGARATTKDHSAPVSVVASIMSVGLDVSGKFLVPACRECNSIAGDKIFVSIGAKRRYIQDRLRHKYEKLLSMPNWYDDEIEEMGYSLQQAIRTSLSQRDYVRSRIAWRNNRNMEPAKLAAVRLRMVALNRIEGTKHSSDNDYYGKGSKKSQKQLIKEYRRECEIKTTIYP